jgi:23S rRNA (adenine2503-C2)-methyltransferase
MELIVSLQNAPDPGENALVPGKIDLKGMTEQELVAFCAEAGEPDYRGRQVFAWIWGKGETEISRMSDLPASFRGLLGERARIGWLEAENIMSGADGTEKFLWRLGDGNRIESVRIPMPRTEGGMRWSLCISTQVGCAMGCAFCLTAKMGFHRQLSASEIAEQFLAARRRLPEGERYHNVVFMGMGEPLDNFDATVAAVGLLTHPRGIGLAPRRLTVSTVGISSRLEDFVRQAPGVGVAVSLHAADEETRSRIVPVNRKWGLMDILKACKALPFTVRQRITFEYVLLSGVNDSLEDARKLAALLGDIRCKVNLLPWNPFDGAPFERPPKPRVEAFRRTLADRGLTVTVRQSKGLDIRAACGQLADDVKMAEHLGKR